MRLALLAASFLALACASDRTRDEAHSAPEPARKDAASAARAEPLDPREDPTFARATTRGGSFLVAWRARGGAVPKNEPFELEVRVYADNLPLPGAALSVSAWMPDHGHGMLRVPAVEDQGDGSYRVSGMLLHMRGFWQVFVDVVSDGYSERAEFALELR